MTEKNNKVPIAILSCFLIAFILQGVLKLSGILVFEKALSWEIFSVIDKYFWLQVVYYSIFAIIGMYCLSFTLTTKPYSKKWYHYFIIIAVAFLNSYIKLKHTVVFRTHILFDVLMYIAIPLFINFTSERKNRLNFNLFNIVLTISMQIALYFCYLGLCYWSSLLNTLILINPILISASANFLIQSELYMGLVVLMLSFNVLLNNIKGEK